MQDLIVTLNTTSRSITTPSIACYYYYCQNYHPLFRDTNSITRTELFGWHCTTSGGLTLQRHFLTELQHQLFDPTSHALKHCYKTWNTHHNPSLLIHPSSPASDWPSLTRSISPQNQQDL
jgi:hypothetical protein